MTETLSEGFSFPSKMRLFLDFDGTLADFQDNPDDVHLTESECELLRALNQHLSGAIAFISGRDIRDLAKRTPKEIWRIGNHGLYSAPPLTMPPSELPEFPKDLLQDILDVTSSHKGVWTEQKGPVIAVHTRANPEAEPQIIKALGAMISGHEDYCLQNGHNVIEVKPITANKGAGLLRQMDIPPFKGGIAVMIGDDTTDEDAFAAAASLGGFGIKIGLGPTNAPYRIETISNLYALLRTII